MSIHPYSWFYHHFEMMFTLHTNYVIYTIWQHASLNFVTISDGSWHHMTSLFLTFKSPFSQGSIMFNRHFCRWNHHRRGGKKRRRALPMPPLPPLPPPPLALMDGEARGWATLGRWKQESMDWYGVFLNGGTLW